MRPEQARPCGPDPVSWFGRGMWPRCDCGFDPKDNAALTEHWRGQGFRVVDEHGSLIKYATAERRVGDVLDLTIGTGSARKHGITHANDNEHFEVTPLSRYRVATPSDVSPGAFMDVSPTYRLPDDESSSRSATTSEEVDRG